MVAVQSVTQLVPFWEGGNNCLWIIFLASVNGMLVVVDVYTSYITFLLMALGCNIANDKACVITAELTIYRIETALALLLVFFYLTLLI